MSHYNFLMLKLANKINRKLASNKFDVNIIKTINYYFEQLYGIYATKEDINEWIGKNPELEKAVLATNRYLINDYYNSSEVILSIDTSSLENSLVISKTHDIPNCRSKSVVFLLPYKNIPQLYLHRIDLEEFYRRAMTPEEVEYYQHPLMAKMDWLRPTIDSYDSRRISSSDKLKECIDSNLSEFEKISKYQDAISPEFLGEGEDGSAWKISPNLNYVIKLSKDSYGYQKAMESIDLIHKFPSFAKTETRIYDGGVIKIHNKNMYYYILEEMSPIRSLEKEQDKSKYIKNLHAISHLTVVEIEKEREMFKKIKNFYENISHKNIKDLSQEEKEMTSKVESYISTWSKDLKSKILNEGITLMRGFISPQDIKDIGVNLNLNIKNNVWLENFIEEYLVKYITSRTDLHFGNLGITNYGQLRFFDPAHRSFTSEINY